MESNDPSNMTFWDHVDELRKVLFRIIGVVVVFMLIAFCFKDELFRVVLAPKESDFLVYRLFDYIGEALHLTGSLASDGRNGFRFPRATHQHQTVGAIPHPHERVFLCGHRAGFTLYYIPTVPFRLARPLRQRTALLPAGSGVGICTVPVGRIVQLFPGLPLYLPFPCPLSGKPGSGKRHPSQFVY